MQFLPKLEKKEREFHRLLNYNLYINEIFRISIADF